MPPDGGTGGLAGTAGKVPSAAPIGLAGSAVQVDLVGGRSADPAVAGADPAVAGADSDAGSRLGADAEVVPPGRSAAGAGTAVLAAAGLGGAGLTGAALAGAGLAGAGLAGAGLGGVGSDLLVKVGHGPLSGSADRAARAALPVLPAAAGLLAISVGAEAGTAG
ncbi:MAG TPA: hypothetical protein VF940_28505 [Streptosporangiaceae bacterium]